MSLLRQFLAVGDTHDPNEQVNEARWRFSDTIVGWYTTRQIGEVGFWQLVHFTPRLGHFSLLPLLRLFLTKRRPLSLWTGGDRGQF